jgi:hypothetical protein
MTAMIRSGESPAAGPSAAPGGGADSAYVYGVVRDAGAHADVSEGVGSRAAPVRVVASAGLAAVVSDVPPDWHSAARGDVETHDRVLARFLDREAVVPMRFGIVMESDDQVRERLLERHAGELLELLERLEGRVQMAVKAYYVDESLLREVLRRRAELKRRSDELEGLPVAATQQERIALGRDVAAAVEEQRALDERTLVEPLAQDAVDLRVDPVASDRQALSVQLLVDAQRRPQLDATVRRLTDEHRERFAFRYVGPLAPYSFSDFSLDEEAR